MCTLTWRMVRYLLGYESQRVVASVGTGASLNQPLCGGSKDKLYRDNEVCRGVKGQ